MTVMKLINDCNEIERKITCKNFKNIEKKLFVPRCSATKLILYCSLYYCL